MTMISNDLCMTVIQHDLLNDIHLIHMELELAIVKHETGTDNPEDMVKTMKSAIATLNRMTTLLQSLNSLNDAPISIGKLLEEIVETAKESWGRMTVDTMVDERVADCTVVASGLLRSVIDNLLRNCDHHITGDYHVDINVSSNHGRLIIEVSDNGPGVSPDLYDTIFQKGTSTQGSGLGLYLSRRIMKGFGGEIVHVLSETGAMFRIILPIDTPYDLYEINHEDIIIIH